MEYNYYLDESGNSGDLVKAKPDLEFGKQPIFALSCVGLKDFTKAESFIRDLRSKYEIEDGELKSSEIYFSKPNAILELAQFLTTEGCPILVELVDKKYCVTTSIVVHHIMPPYFMPDESDGKAQFIRNALADYLAINMHDECYAAFFTACIAPTEANLLESMGMLRNFFLLRCKDMEMSRLTIRSIDHSIDDYQKMKSILGEEDAVKKFIPIPDMREKGVEVHLLPHVHSIYNLIARINKYHLGNISGVTLHHDEQEEFKKIFISCNEYLKGHSLSGDFPPIPNADFNFKEALALNFVNSSSNAGVQIADIIAGYFNRYVNGLLYKKVEMLEVYNEIFFEFRKRFRPGSPLGVNLVIPESLRDGLFKKFRF